jgi:hypothetical protein
MKNRSLLNVFAVGLFCVLAPTMATAGDCLSRPEIFRLQSETVQWSMVIARGDECIQGLRGKTMILESVTVVEQPKKGRVVVQGPSFRYFAGPEAGIDSFKLVVVGSSMRMNGTSMISVEVQVR